MTLKLPPERAAALRPFGPYLAAPHDPLLAGPGNPHLVHLYESALDPLVIGRDPDGSALLDSHRLIPVAEAGWMLHLPWEKNPLPANKKQHGHWAQESGYVAQVRNTARTLALRVIPPQDGITVRLDWEVTTIRDRDEDNLVRCMKALVDGIRLAGVIPKDTRPYCKRIMPEINYAPSGPGRPAAHFRLWIWPGAD